MQHLVFDPETKTAEIGLDVLDRTVKLEHADGKLPVNAPIEHSTLIKNVIEMGNRFVPKEIKPVLLPITIAQKNCRRIMWDGPKDECPVEKYLVERMICKISFTGSEMFMDDKQAAGRMAVAVSYNERGIQVGFGHNVRICQNLNVFGDFVFSTYGGAGAKVPFTKGMELLEKWLRDFSTVQELNRSKIQFLKERMVTEYERQQLLGKMFELAVRANEGDKDANAPLNVTECGMVVKAGYDRLTKDTSITAWDLTNWATSILKPATSDMVTLVGKNNRLNNFILDQFQLN